MTHMTTQRIRRALAANIKNRRMKAKMSQTDLAILIGVRQSYISCIESAREGVTVDTITKLAVALHTNPSRLLKLV